MNNREHYGIIIRHLRKLEDMSVRKCAATIGRSIGWLSEIENGAGTARLTDSEFERIITILNGKHHKPMFKTWIATHKNQTRGNKTFDGAVLKHIRKKKGMTLAEASAIAELSIGYLSKIESGLKPVDLQLRNRIMAAYGYRSSSFKNLSTDPVRSKAVPISYKLGILLKQASPEIVEHLFNTLNNELQKNN